MNSEYLIQSNPPLLYYLLHIIDRVWVKYCYWEPVNQTIQYYSLNHPRTSLSDYKVFDMRLLRLLNKTKYFRIQRFDEIFWSMIEKADEENQREILRSERCTTSFWSNKDNFELLLELKRKLITLSYQKDFKKRREN